MSVVKKEPWPVAIQWVCVAVLILPIRDEASGCLKLGQDRAWEDALLDNHPIELATVSVDCERVHCISGNVIRIFLFPKSVSISFQLRYPQKSFLQGKCLKTKSFCNISHLQLL